MKRNNKMEEIQTRREFFKNAAKSALPILGVIMMVSSSQVAKAVQVTGCSGCYDYCQKGCKSGCEGKCSDHCAKSCSDRNCMFGCRGGCKNGQNIN